jgi:restriction system protein
LKSRQAEIERVKNEIEDYKKTIKGLQEQYSTAAKKWMAERKRFLLEREQSNAAIDKKKEKYLNGDLSSVMDYCDIVLTNSNYPDYFPKTYEIDYNPENKITIVDYQLPSPNVIPTVTEVKYVQARNEYQEKNLSQVQLNKLYDSVLYQIALRTIHELYEADVINGLQSVVFNGYVTSINPATGQEATSCVFSVQANKEEFEQINLANIDPKACFKKLRGVGSSKLHSLTPIAPILQMDKDDRRFVSSYDVTSELNDNHNLAAMDWEDFEHLIREIFEKEFSIGGGEVKVTQASRDGGVDAVAFDPDPIRGGKVVIQAKRYTNIVGVSAVRDLYGTVMNEGANKGILVTTADYGPDAYSFAKGKPLTLLNGSNLLHLLEKHGHSFRIDLNEAKKILADKEKE